MRALRCPQAQAINALPMIACLRIAFSSLSPPDIIQVGHTLSAFLAKRLKTAPASRWWQKRAGTFDVLARPAFCRKLLVWAGICVCRVLCSRSRPPVNRSALLPYPPKLVRHPSFADAFHQPTFLFLEQPRHAPVSHACLLLEAQTSCYANTELREHHLCFSL